MKKIKTKIKSLEREISELRRKKAEEDKFKRLLSERNRLKFRKVINVGRGLKKFGEAASKEFSKASPKRKKRYSKDRDNYFEMDLGI